MGNIGFMEEKMESTVVHWGLYWWEGLGFRALDVGFRA